MLLRILAFAAIYLVWGSTYLGIKIGLETMPPFLMAGVRFLLAGLILFGWALARGGCAPTPRQWMLAVAVGGLMLVGGNGLVTWAEMTVPSGLAAVMVGLVPLWMVLLDRMFFGGALSRRMVAGLVIGILGVVLLVGPSNLAGERVDRWGALALVLATASWALGSLLSRRVALPRSPWMTTAIQMVAAGAIMIGISGGIGEWGRVHLEAISPRSWWALGYLIVFGSIVALSAYVWLLREVSAASVSTYAFVNPVVAVLLGWGLGNEPLTPRALVATGCVLTAVLLLQWARMRPRVEVCTPDPRKMERLETLEFRSAPQVEPALAPRGQSRPGR